MFGALLWIGQELGRQRIVLGWAFSSRTGAGDRADHHLAVAHAHQDLGTRADDLEAAKIEEAKIRRRIDPPQRPIKGERRYVQAAREPLRQYDLEGVARRDIVLRPGDHRKIFGLGRIRPRFARLDERTDGPTVVV